MLRPEQDVEAEDALEERRDGERHELFGMRGHGNPDHPILYSAEQLRRTLADAEDRGMRNVLFGTALTAALLAMPGPAHAQNHVLIAKVGFHDAYTISLRTPNGKLIRSLPAGTYSIVVHDYSKLHNFALGSVTENKRLFTGGIRFVGTKTYTVTLTPGTYAYACSAHPQTMHGTFAVT
jgi:hypothetical protein